MISSNLKRRKPRPWYSNNQVKAEKILSLGEGFFRKIKKFYLLKPFGAGKKRVELNGEKNHFYMYKLFLRVA
jgi:hypothetical protein